MIINNLKHRKVLILAGPTWMPIDRVRVITNVFTGELGLEIARAFYRRGASVILLFGPGRRELIDKEKDKFKIIYFAYFKELLKLALAKARQSEVIVCSAAVSDYQPKFFFAGKIKSKKKNLRLDFKPTLKIIDLLRRANRKALLVKFKLEVSRDKTQLVKIAGKSMHASKADFIVANTLDSIRNKRHLAYILDKTKRIIACTTKKQIARQLVESMARHPV